MSADNQQLARRTFLERLCACGGATATAWTGCHGTPNATRQTNVLLILTEDQGAQTGALGTKGLRTPNMDAIAEQGVMFRKRFRRVSCLLSVQGSLVHGPCTLTPMGCGALPRISLFPLQSFRQPS